MGRKKINLITRTWERCRSLTNQTQIHQIVAPEGCFSVYVGAEKQRFVVKMEYLNHPLFKLLLEDAESEFGFAAGGGPLVLPCDVDLFYRVLAEIENGDDDDLTASSPGCVFVCSPARRSNCRRSFARGSCGSSEPYSVLANPSRMIKMN